MRRRTHICFIGTYMFFPRVCKLKFEKSGIRATRSRGPAKGFRDPYAMERPGFPIPGDEPRRVRTPAFSDGINQKSGLPKIRIHAERGLPLYGSFFLDTWTLIFLYFQLLNVKSRLVEPR